MPQIPFRSGLAVMASSGVSGRFGGQGAATRVGFAKMGGGYGVLVAGRF
jgi:hypothetical protein